MITMFEKFPYAIDLPECCLLKIFWVLGFGFWVMGFGFWVLGFETGLSLEAENFGFWIFEMELSPKGLPRFAVWISNRDRDRDGNRDEFRGFFFCKEFPIGNYCFFLFIISRKN